MAILAFSLAARSNPISSVMPSGGEGFDPWNKTRWVAWYDANGVLVEPFEFDVSVTFAPRETPWWFNANSVRRIHGDKAAVFILTADSDIVIDGNGVVIDIRPEADLSRDLYYYYTTTINLNAYSVVSGFMVYQTNYAPLGSVGSRITNMTLKGCIRGIETHHDHRRKITIENVDLVRNHFGVFPRGQNGTVRDCQFLENIMAGFYCEYNSYDWVIENNIFKDNNNRGTPSYGELLLDACRNYTVTGNVFQTATYFTRPYHTAISLYRNQGENGDVRELAARDHLIANNTFNDYHVAIDFGVRQAASSITTDSSGELRCYTMNNTVCDNVFNDCKIGVLLRNNYTTLSNNVFNDTEVDIAMLNAFYAMHHNTIDQSRP